LLDRFSPAAPVKLFGHSMGGNIAGLYAGIMPERVSHFVNVEGFGLRDRDPADAPANYRRWLETGRTGSAYGTYASYDELAARIHKRSPRMPLAHARYVAAAWASEGADGRIHIKADPAHKLPNPVLYRRSEAEACWQQVTAEVLLVSGVDSEFNSETLSWVETDAADLPFPGAQHQQIADAGHMIHFEQPAALAAMVERFLPGP
jgi:pimeloyl-ACP methyl ester carboxylesterase